MLDRESYLCGTIRERFERLERQTSHPYITKHFQLDQLITSVYRERDVPGKIDECIEYCKEDIALYPDFIKIWLETNRNPPRIRPFARLAIIYEKQEKYSEASEVVRIGFGVWFRR